MKGSQRTYLALLVGVFVSLFVLLFVLRTKEIVVYAVAYIAVSLVFLLLCRFILKNSLPGIYVWGLLTLAVLLRLSLLAVHPIGSNDYYRYLWDGRVMASGINPYRYAPNDPALAALHTADLPSRVNFPSMRTLYPPLAEAIFYVAHIVTGDNILGLKSILFIFGLFTLYGIFLILKKVQLDSKNILIYALCPLPLFEFYIDGHVDGFGITLLVFALYFLISDRKLLGYIFIGLSACVKPTGLILVPLLFFIEKDGFERLKLVVIPLAICAIAYLPFVFTGFPFVALMKFTENWTFNGIVFDAINLFIRNNQLTRSICGGLFVVSFLPVMLGRKDFMSKVYVSIFILLIFSPVVHPWYLGWLAFLLPIKPRWSGILYVSLISLTVITEMNYQLSGVWTEYPFVLVLEYVPVLSAFLLELFSDRLRRLPILH